MKNKVASIFTPKENIMEFRAGYCGQFCDICKKEVVWYFGRNYSEVICGDCAYNLGLVYKNKG